ncbi:MAG: hypothetical protein HOW97_28265 [Catenulispora sp.]|nr:hypothetical protein [Catenulispora sp.]
MRRTVLTAVIVAALLAGGCASKPDSKSSGAVRPTSPPPAPVPAKNDCSELAAAAKSGGLYQPPPATGSLPADARPVSLLQCTTTVQGAPDQGQWSVVQTVRSTGSVDGFVRALRANPTKPPEKDPGKNYACPAIGYVEPWIVLVDADGKAYQIQVPRWGVCNGPDPDVLKALDAVPTKVVSTERIQQTLSPQAQAGDCVQQYAEMAFVQDQWAQATTGSPPPFFAPKDPTEPVHACYYKLEANYEKAKPAGDFDGAATIPAGQGAALHDSLANAPASTTESCDTPAAEFAVVTGNAFGKGGSVIELSGCKLATSDPGPDHQVPDSLIQALLAAKK